MWMRAHTGINPVMLLGKRDSRIQLLRAGAGANRQQRGNASRPRALQHRLAILRKLRKINMSMRIDQFHLYTVTFDLLCSGAACCAARLSFISCACWIFARDRNGFSAMYLLADANSRSSRMTRSK